MTAERPVPPQPAHEAGYRVDEMARSLLREDLYGLLHTLHRDTRPLITAKLASAVELWHRLDAVATDAEGEVANLDWPDHEVAA